MATKKEEILETAENIVEDVKETVKKAAPKAKEAAEKVEKAAKTVAKKAEKAVKETVEKAEAVVEEAKETVSEAAEKTVKKAEKAVKATAEKAEAVAEDVKAAAAETVEKAAKQVEKAAQKVEKAAKKSKGAKQENGAFSEAPRLKLRYQTETIPALREQFGYKNVMEVPKLEKIILNMGLGADKDNPKGIEVAVKELSTIAGQKAVITKAKKSVANFKVREGMNVGAMVTLRGDRMYYFADKLMNIVLPRVRDFRGVSDKSFDGRGNFAMGVKEQLIFPEINYDDVDKVRGMNIVFVTSAKTDEEAKALLTLLGMPFVQA